MMSLVKRGSLCSCFKDPSTAYVAMEYETKAKLEKCFSMNLEGDDDDCGSVGVLLLPVGGRETMVVLDSHNECIKTFSLGDGELLTNRYTLDDKPSSITKVADDKIAVSFFESKKLSFYSLNEGLTLEKSLETEKQYYSLACINKDRFVASAVWDNPVTVDFLEIKDHVKIVKSVSSFEGKSIFTCPENISVTSKGIVLISDHGKKSLVCMDQDGTVKFNCHPECHHEFEVPLGVTSDSDGYIYIVDQSRCLVEKLSNEGKFLGHILTEQDGLENPVTVGFDERGQLYISQENGDLKIFTLFG
ncbi:uncharacterized protein LOC126829591 [Patella vulgata]|uniref:uncharacterized protein LOC126829591 n=1 Tax=Patella vulgata TaxID=6465 RepID=UPI0021808A35|nr:uncharacterized protein LOC126829591 [Patella vulgata]